jgi:hypothetical protein
MRTAIRIGLIVAILVSTAVIAAAFRYLGPRAGETWAVVAAALAVITSVVSSWTGQRVLELQEDSQRPYPYPTIDTTSRYGFLQLRVTNFGGVAAHEIRLRWDQPLVDSDGHPVHFSAQMGSPDVPVLLPKESIAVPIGVPHRVFAKGDRLDYSGHVECKDPAGHRVTHRFTLSLEKHRHSLLCDDEAVKTGYELQKLPERLDAVVAELRQLRLLAEQRQDRQPGGKQQPNPGIGAVGRS